MEAKPSKTFEFEKLTKKELVHLLVLVETTSCSAVIWKALSETQFGAIGDYETCAECKGIHKKDIFRTEAI